MGNRIYKPARLRVFVLLLLAAALAGSGAACMLHARMLLRSTLDGRRECAETETYVSEFALRAQMNIQQADAKVNGFMTFAAEQEVFLTVGGEERFARLFDPVGGTDKAPWALLLHGGIGSDGTELLDLACELSLSGFKVLLPDLRAHGRSEGDLTSLGLRESMDVTAWVRWIGMREPEARILVFGEDEGAVSALFALGSIKDSVAAVAADSAYSDIHIRAAELFAETHADANSIEKRLFHLAFDAAIADWSQNTNLLEMVRGCEIPLLLIHGTGDENVPAWHSEDIAKAAGEKAEVFFIEGAAHRMSRFVEPKAYYERLIGFFRSAMQPDEGMVPAG